MAVWQVLLLAAAMELPAAEVETLNGDKHAGSLATLSDTGVVLRKGETDVSVPLSDVLELRLLSNEIPDPATGARIAFLDGTRLTCGNVTVKNDKARLESPLCGTVEVPVARIASVRFGISTKTLDEMWEKLLTRESKTDLLVVKKEDANKDVVLDFLTGVAGDVGEKVNFLIDGDEIPVGREKVYGLIFHRRTMAAAKPAAQVALLGGDVLQVSEAVWDGTAFKMKLAAGGQATVAADKVLSLDFSAGKVRYLSQMEPRDMKYTPFFDDKITDYAYRRDRTYYGHPLKLAGKTYGRGLWIHSKTFLRYRIAGDYNRFKALMGIDDDVRPKGNVHVVISADGKVLHESDVKGSDAPVALDLDVSGVRDLDILVDFGTDIDIADHLDLIEARVVK